MTSLNTVRSYETFLAFTVFFCLLISCSHIIVTRTSLILHYGIHKVSLIVTILFFEVNK